MDFVDNGLHLGISHASTTSALGLHHQKLVILSISTEKPMLKEVPVVNGEK